VNTGSPCGILKDHLDRVLSVAFSPNSLYLASASSDSTVGIWSVKTGDLENILEEHLREVTGVAFSADGLFIASSSADGLVKL
jgi:WD40 repeat protein